MTTVSLEPDELKRLMKSAFAEALEERRDWVRDIIDEALEDLALQRAIEEGVESREVSRAEVFAILDSAR
jgi:hypothetical protein